MASDQDPDSALLRIIIIQHMRMRPKTDCLALPLHRFGAGKGVNNQFCVESMGNEDSQLTVSSKPSMLHGFGYLEIQADA